MTHVETVYGSRIDQDSIRDIVDEIVIDDPQLKPHEKQFGTFMEGDSNIVSVTAMRASMVKRLLAHPYFDLSIANTLSGDGSRSTISSLHELDTDEKVTTIVGRIPMGILKMMLNPRKSNRHAEIVTRDVFDH